MTFNCNDAVYSILRELEKLNYNMEQRNELKAKELEILKEIKEKL